MTERATVLVVEDNPITRKVFRVALATDGYRTLEADDGQSALQVVRDGLPDLILLDLGLPDMDGLELMHCLRSLPGGDSVPIVGITGHLFRLQSARSVPIGFTDLLFKPVEPSHLCAAVPGYLKASAWPPISIQKTVLAVDGDATRLKLLKVQIERGGFRVATAGTTCEALELARRSRPHVILAHVLVQPLDGLRLCLAIRQDPALAGVVVILMDESVSPDDVDLARDAGASACVPSPSEHVDVVDTIKRALCMPPPPPVPGAPLFQDRYLKWLQTQLDRQLGVTADVARRLALAQAQTETLAGLRAVSTRGESVEILLGHLLNHCLDAWGVSLGAGYLREADGTLSLRASLGCGEDKHELAQQVFHCADLVGHAIARGEVTLVRVDDAPTQQARALLRRLEAEGLLITPITLDAAPLGAMVMITPMTELDPASISFARAVGSQVAYAVALARAVGELRDNEDRLRAANADLERRVQERTAELKCACDEMEAFSYSISHDLRAPLRAIEGYSQLLLEDCHDGRPLDAGYATRIREQAIRMGHLITSLLEFARLSRKSLSRRDLDLADLVQAVLYDLQPETAGRRVEIRIDDDLPDCWADPTLLHQVFTNLLSNALKFTRPRDPACIRVGATSREGTPVYFVQDNGVGFDMKHKDRLFGVFHRLHSAHRFEGFGVGLALVQRIINRHGGRIWAEAEIDRGATFSFTLGQP